MRMYRLTLGIVLLIVAIGAIPAGLGYLDDPSGQGLGQSTELLKNSPFNNFLIPGLFLLIVNGIGSLTGALLAFARHRYAGITGFLLGIILCLWICIQVYWITFNSFLQPLVFGLGLLEILFGYLVMKKSVKQPG